MIGDVNVKLSVPAAERVDRLIVVLERIANAAEKLAELADFEANGPRW